MNCSIGEKYGFLEIVSEWEPHLTKGGAKKKTFLCRCICNKIIIVWEQSLKQGNTKSCGCLKTLMSAIKNKTHGKCCTKEYHCWEAMIQRCTNPKNPEYKNYGERGIIICERWFSFENFLEDMGDCPAGMSIERINVNSGYNKENCTWANTADQAYNKRKRSDNTSGRIGVTFRKDISKWRAYITKKGNRIELGVFDSFEAACEARKEAELVLYGKTKETE